MDADEVATSRTVIRELVRGTRRHDDDVAGPRVLACLINLECEAAFYYHPRLVVRVPVQPRPMTRLAVVEDQRNLAAVILALQCSGLECGGVDDLQGWVYFLFGSIATMPGERDQGSDEKHVIQRATWRAARAWRLSSMESPQGTLVDS